MSQNWNMPTSATVASAALNTNIPDALEALRTLHSGTSAPSSTVADMLWMDTTNGILKQRNSANSAWIAVAKRGVDWTYSVAWSQYGALSATTVHRVLCLNQAVEIKRVILLSDTVSSSSSGNEWQFSLQNATTTNQLFSGTVGNFTTLGGVGGGAEFAVDTAFALVPDQNTGMSADDVLLFTFTKVGTVTTLADVAVGIEYSLAG